MNGRERINKVLHAIQDRYGSVRRTITALEDAKEYVNDIVSSAKTAKHHNGAPDYSTRLHSQLVLAVLQDKFEKGEL